MKITLLLFVSILSSFPAISQTKNLDYFICTTDSIYLDTETYKSKQLDDSTYKINTGAIKISLKNPYLLKLKILKRFDDNNDPKNITVRYWSHEQPNLWLNDSVPFLFTVEYSESKNIYEIHDHYEVFRLWNGKWAEPTGVRYLKPNEPKKALLNYDLLKRKNTRYYRDIEKLLNCCKPELDSYYSKEIDEL